MKTNGRWFLFGCIKLEKMSALTKTSIYREQRRKLISFVKFNNILCSHSISDYCSNGIITSVGGGGGDREALK